jgi:hypothetical protein
MKTKRMILTASIALAMAIGACSTAREVYEPAFKPDIPLPHAILDLLVTTIHKDLLDLQKEHVWLEGYTDNALLIGRNRSISFIPKNADQNSGINQQPEQLSIGYVPIGEDAGFKTDNDIQNVRWAHFPSLQADVYVHIVARGGQNTRTARAIRELVIWRCEELHKIIGN